MSTINFFTAVTFEGYANPSCSQRLLEEVDGYFQLGGDNSEAYVICGHMKKGSEGVVLRNSDPSSLKTVLKVVSYFTLVFPAIMLVAKGILRSIHRFHLIKGTPKELLKLEVAAERAIRAIRRAEIKSQAAKLGDE